MTKNSEAKEMKKIVKKKEKMDKILEDMQIKMDEISGLRKDLMREHLNTISPQDSKSLLEEIKVPSISLIKEEKK